MRDIGLIRRGRAPLAVGLLLALTACAGGSSAPAGGGGGGGGANDTGCVGGALCGSSMDTNHDGSISQQEWDNAFSRADSDGDGAVSQSELETAGGHWGGGGDGGGDGGGGGRR
ncbi:MAG: hypothetical protein U1E17_23640 [Geminicoccaceae bacterium]